MSDTWTDLSDDELRARLEQRFPPHHPDIEFLIARRDEPDSEEVIDRLLERERVD